MSDQLYRQQIIDHFRNPRNGGILKDFDVKYKVFNTSCGDEAEVYIKVKDGKVENVSFDTRGCAISVASASLLSEEIKNMSLEEILDLNEEFMQEMIGTQLTSSRVKCAMLGLEAVKNGIEEYRKNNKL